MYWLNFNKLIKFLKHNTNLPFPFCRGTFQNLMQIEIQSDELEICEHFYHSQVLQKFYVFCKNTLSFSIKIIDTDNNKSQMMTNLQFDETINLRNCTQEVIQLNDSTFFLAFYDCENWRFYKIIDKTIAIVLDQSFFKEKVYPQQFQYCQDGLYLTKLINQQTNRIEQFYYFILFNQNYIIQISKIHFQEEIEILKIVLTNHCQVHYIIYQQQSEVKNIFNYTSNEVFISSQFKNSKAYLVNELFLIQSLSTLLIIKNEFQNQTYQFLNAPINFLNIFNSFYQLDLKKEQIIFYQFKKQQMLNKLEKKYFWILQNPGLFELSQILCYEIQINNFLDLKNNNDSPISILINYNCELSGDIQINNIKANILNNFTYPIESENKYLSINDRTNLSEQCLKKLPNLFQNQSYKILFANYQKDQYYLIKSQDTLLLYECDSNQFQTQFKVQDYQVFYYQHIFLLIKDDSQIQLYNLDHNQFIKMNEINQGKILQILQIDNNFIIKYQEQQYFINVNYFQLLPQILNDQNLISKDQEILYFIEIVKKFYLVQYQNYFIISWDDQLFYQDLVDQNIVFVSKLKQGCFIVSVSNSKNLLSLYQFNKFELSLVVNESIAGYEFVRPLIYKSKLDIIAIQATQQSQQFILVLSVQNKKYIELIRIIKCQNCNFWLSLNSIYLIDQSQNMYCIQLSLITLNYKLPETLNTYVTSRVSEKFINQFDISTNIQIDLILVNQCFDLKPVNKEIFLSVNSIISLQLEDFFYGPIDAFQIDNSQQKFDFYDSQIKKQAVEYCSTKSLLPICIQQINFYYQHKNNTIQTIKKSIYINKLKNEVVIFSNQHKLDNYNSYFMFQNQDHYFFLSIISNKAMIFEFQIDVGLQQYSQLKYFELFDFAKNFDLEKTGDLIILKSITSNLPEIVYLFYKSKFYLQVQIMSLQQTIQIKNFQPKNQNYDTQFITVSQHSDNSNFYLQFDFYEISNFQLTLNQSFKILQEDLLKECQTLSIQDYCHLLNSYNMIIIDGAFTHEILSLNWLMTENCFSILIKASLDLNNQQKIKFEMKLIRHNMAISSAKVFLFNEILHLKIGYSSYLYNLKQSNKSLFYDYFSDLQTSMVQITQFNSTHLLLFFQNIYPYESRLAFQQIQNQLTLDENYFSQENTNSTFTLIASNKLQRSSISITIQNNIEQQKKRRRIILYNLLFQFLGLLLVIYILFIKKKRNQNLKLLEFIKRIKIQNQEKI